MLRRIASVPISAKPVSGLRGRSGEGVPRLLPDQPPEIGSVLAIPNEAAISQELRRSPKSGESTTHRLRSRPLGHRHKGATAVTRPSDAGLSP